MTKEELRLFCIKSVGRSPEKESQNPAFDSLDKLEIISALHDKFGDAAGSINDLDNFFDLDSLFDILKTHELVS